MGRLTRTLIVALAAALVLPAVASAYGWPLARFHRQHPIRGYFGDPRTIYWDPFEPGRFPENGQVSFHDGVDIVADPGQPVYPVLTGVVHRAGGERVIVRTRDGRRFEYVHVDPSVRRGQRVRAGRTVLGHVELMAGHVHLTELSRTGRAVDPLLRGHLEPYFDGTVPRVPAIEVRSTGGRTLDPLSLRGFVAPVAEAFDNPAMTVHGSWYGMPVAPASLRWTLRRSSTGKTVRHGVPFDFRRLLPARNRFWHVYARGTYQNHPRFAGRQYPKLRGRYLYRLGGVLDTRSLRDGVYVLRVAASDTRGNVGVRRQVVGICNVNPAPCRRLERARSAPGP
jgi:murein DD-endopeptidase MepM/ murein hydrolase activator NlpD